MPEPVIKETIINSKADKYGEITVNIRDAYNSVAELAIAYFVDGL